MQKITKILEAKNIEFYDDGNIKSTDNADSFLLKFKANDYPDLKLIIDKKHNNSFTYAIYKDCVIIEGDSSQSFAFHGME